MKRALLVLLVFSAAACSRPEPPAPPDLSQKPLWEIEAMAKAEDPGAIAELARRSEAVAYAETVRLREARTAFEAAIASGDETRISALADADNPFALHYEAEKLLGSDQPSVRSQGFAMMEAAAEAGSPDAMVWVGYRMAQGADGYPWKPNSGLLMVQDAARTGHAEAMYTLGLIYSEGPMADPAQAEEWMRKAADAGSAPAADALRRMGRPAGTP